MSLKKHSKPGDAFIGLGSVLVAFAVILWVIAAVNGFAGPGVILWLFLGLALIGLGYLRRMAVAVEKKSGQGN